MADENNHLQNLVAEVSAAYFSNTHVSVQDIPQVISQIATSLAAVNGQPQSAEQSPTEEQALETPAKKLTPAQVRKSITPDALISFEDGKGYKTLRRHLSVKGLTPEQYREKWSLPKDYPMVSPTYSAQRSAMARSIGLGQKGRGARAGRQAAPAPEPNAPARRGRKP